MIQKDKVKKSLKLIHNLILKARIMAYQKEEHSVIASFLDDVEYLQALLLSENDCTNIFYKHSISIGEEYECLGFIEDYNQDNDFEREIIHSQPSVQKKYTVEMKVKYTSENPNLLLELKRLEVLITGSNIVGKGVEHESFHYVETTYYKWLKDDTNIKMYIDDYSQNSLCLDISSSSLKVSYNTSTKISKLLETELVKIEITKSLELNS